MNPRIVMALPDAFPPDIRVTKEAATLQAAGYELVVCCPKRPGQPARETIEGIAVVRVPTPDRSDWVRRLARNARVALTAYRPEWAATLTGLAREGIDAIHVHDLPLAGTALRVGDRYGVPVVLDLHENYPEALRQWRRADPDWWRDPHQVAHRCCFPLRRYKRLERHWTKRADHVLAVCGEARRHYIRDCALAPAYVDVVSNTVDLDVFDPTTATADSTGLVDSGDSADPAVIDPDEFTVSYVGTFGPHRGLDTAVRAFARLASETPPARLVLVGSGGGAVCRDLRALVEDLDIGPQVTFTGHVAFEEVPGYVAASDVCLVPHASTPHTETTIPHKLFQYMAMETPVLVTDVTPLKRIVEETDAGLVTPADDPRAMAGALRALRENSAERERLGRAGRRAVERNYNWARDAAILCAVYERLLADDPILATDEQTPVSTPTTHDS